MKKLLLVLCLLCLANSLFAKGEKKLFKAVQDNDLVKIEELLTKGANLNVLDKDGYSPLRYAIKKNDINLVKFLIEKGADVNFKYKSDGFPLSSAISSVVDINIFKLLIEKGADVNEKYGLYSTSLIYALSWGHIEVAKILIEKGADVNAKANNRLTALDYAINNDALDVAKILLKKGATGEIFDEPAIIVYNVNINDYGYFNVTLESYDMEGNLVDSSRPIALQGVSPSFTMKTFTKYLKEYGHLYMNSSTTNCNYDFIESKVIDSNNFQVIFESKLVSLLKK